MKYSITTLMKAWKLINARRWLVLAALADSVGSEKVQNVEKRTCVYTAMYQHCVSHGCNSMLFVAVSELKSLCSIGVGLSD